MREQIFADVVLQGGVVYTADAAGSVCTAVAVRDGRVLFAGDDAAAADYIGPDTKVIDLVGRMVLPGMMDTHIHPPGLALLDLYELPLHDVKSVDGYVEAVRDYIARHPDAKAVYGRGWSWAVLTGEEATKGPRKERLDAVTTTIPVVIRAHDGHTLWVNSRALAENGVADETEEPSGGVIVKDDDGRLWGTLKESAMWLMALPEYSLEEYVAAMAAFQDKMHSFGITGVLIMASVPFIKIFDACEQLEREGRLALRVRGAMTVRPQDDLATQFAAIEEVRRRYDSPKLKVTATKFFTDGVIEGGTSFLLEPYAPAAGKGEGYCGECLWEEDKLAEAFVLANRSGLQIHVHSTGDASTRRVLDALEAARETLPPGDCRNTITHLQLVAKEDIPRMADLDVIASVQPYWQFKGPGWWENVDYQFLGERAEEEFPLGSLFAAGLTVISSSDYPATIVPNPLLAMAIGVTRNLVGASRQGLADITDIDDERYLLGKGERATISQMIDSFTANGAYAMFLEGETGSIETDKRADLVVLDSNLLTVDPLAIDKVKVDMTFFDGRLVYARQD
ncbi:MAG: amidohydrolase [Negativicutes bacterium]|nr:amidohydrolase [Negativicutes bacterium]